MPVGAIQDTTEEEKQSIKAREEESSSELWDVLRLSHILGIGATKGEEKCREQNTETEIIVDIFKLLKLQTSRFRNIKKTQSQKYEEK